MKTFDQKANTIEQQWTVLLHAKRTAKQTWKGKITNDFPWNNGERKKQMYMNEREKIGSFLLSLLMTEHKNAPTSFTDESVHAKYTGISI